MPPDAQLLWSPSAASIRHSSITRFMNWLAASGSPALTSYEELWRWSIDDLDGFWTQAARWLPVRWATAPELALADRSMPGTRWFPGGQLNYAQHLLFPDVHGLDPDAPALLFAREDGRRSTTSWNQLRADVGALQGWLRAQGVGPGDRVASMLPNCPQAVVAMLAATGLGAIWSSCSPDFGLRGAADRFRQIEPTVLFAPDGYVYGGRTFFLDDRIEALRAELPTLRATLVAGYLGEDVTTSAGAVSWTAATAMPGGVTITAMDFDAPLAILYSSGTTGPPKAIVHSHGGILLEHLKELAFHLDLTAADRFFWFTTTGWMMWNFLVSGLALGSTIVLYDGNPAYPAVHALWALAEQSKITVFGVSPAYLQACMKADSHPGREHDLSALRAVGSTGSPLPADAFRWVSRGSGPISCSRHCPAAQTCVRHSSAEPRSCQSGRG